MQGLAVVAELAETTPEDVPHEWSYSLGAGKWHAGVRGELMKNFRTNKIKEGRWAVSCRLEENSST